MDKKSCINCIFAHQKDFGYSNYTVEGTSLDCLFGLVSVGDTCGEKSEKKLTDAAESCKHYTHGTGLYFDCDETDNDGNISDWIKQYIKSGVRS